MARLRSPEGRAVLILLGIPVLLFVVPALFGYPAIAGDNAIQNFPLRAFSGHLIAEGHLPLWNPYIWSGTPLLGGLNAGSAYPLTWLFAFLPPVGAWVVNLLVVYWAAGIGTYVLLRQFRVGILAALLAGLTYMLGGAMTGQLVHLGIVQGMAWMPWLVLALVRLSWSVLGTGSAADGVLGHTSEVSTGQRRSSPWPWVMVLAGTLALVILTGEPRSMAEGEIVATYFTVWLAVRPYGGGIALGRRVRFLALSGLAGVWGVILAGAQILPGWDFISASQRATETYWYFGAGSLRPSWTILMAIPDLFGGNGILGEPSFFNSYNGAEVTGYVGLLPIIATLALATRSFGRRRSARSSDWGPWLTLVGLGLLLTWGSYTPLGHVFAHIPLFGKTRLQSRNLGIVDFAMAVLLGFWADHALRGDHTEAGFLGWRKWVVRAPLLAVGGVLLVALAVPGWLEEHFGAAVNTAATLGRDMTPWFLGQVLVVLLFGVLFFRWSHLDATRRRKFLAGVMLLDLVVFLATTVGGVIPNTDLEPTPQPAASLLGTHGRFAVYDSSVMHLRELTRLGQTDVNTFIKLSSVQGYASILSNFYGTATGTHTMDNLDPCALEAGTFTQLRLETLVTVPGFLAPGVEKNGSVPPPSPACSGVPSPGASGTRTFYTGWAMPLVSAHLVRNTSVPLSAGSGAIPAIGILGSHGGIRYPTASVASDGHGGWEVHFAHVEPAFGLVVKGSAEAVSDTSVLTGQTGAKWGLDGAMQDALSVGGWRIDGTWNGLTFFRHRVTRPPVWTEGAAGARVHEVQVDDWGTEVDKVTSRTAVTVVRSEAYLPGWRVLEQPAGGGPARTVSVEANGIVQAVRVPAGTWTLTFLYRPRTLNLGLLSSAVGSVVLAVGVVLAIFRRKRSTPSSLDS